MNPADHVLCAPEHQFLQAVAGHCRRGLVGKDDHAVLEDHQPLPRVEHQVAIRLLGVHPVGDIAVAGAPAQPAAVRPMHRLADVVDPTLLAGAGDDAKLQGQRLRMVKLVIQVVGEGGAVVGVNDGCQHARVGQEAHPAGSR